MANSHSTPFIIDLDIISGFGLWEDGAREDPDQNLFGPHHFKRNSISGEIFSNRLLDLNIIAPGSYSPQSGPNYLGVQRDMPTLDVSAVPAGLGPGI